MSDKQLLLKDGVQMYRNICNKSGYVFFAPPLHLLIKMTQMLMTAFTTGGTGHHDVTRN